MKQPGEGKTSAFQMIPKLILGGVTKIEKGGGPVERCGSPNLKFPLRNVMDRRQSAVS